MGTLSIVASFGQVVRSHRLVARLTQEELADRSALHPTYIGLIERGVKNPTIQVCQQIADGLDVSLSDLIAQAIEQMSRRDGDQ